MEPFAELDPPLAQAAVAVLRDAGLRAWVEESSGEVDRVYVVRDDQESAERTLSARMEDVQELARRLAADAPPEPGARAAVADRGSAGDGPPLVLERFRRTAAVVTAVLVPVLGVTLAQAALPRGAAIALVGVGAAAVGGAGVAALLRGARRG